MIRKLCRMVWQITCDGCGKSINGYAGDRAHILMTIVNIGWHRILHVGKPCYYATCCPDCGAKVFAKMMPCPLPNPLPRGSVSNEAGINRADGKAGSRPSINGEPSVA